MKFHIVLLAAFFFILPSSAHAGKVKASLIDSQGKKAGKAVFKEIDGGVQILVKASGLKPGAHGMHIHENGACEPPDFKSAGAHFNPHGKKHGNENPQGAHAGDLPNLTVGANGKGKVNFIAPGLSLRGNGAILKPGKTSLVIHAAPDDGKTDPSGNSGDRIVCGVIN